MANDEEPRDLDSGGDSAEHPSFETSQGKVYVRGVTVGDLLEQQALAAVAAPSPDLTVFGREALRRCVSVCPGTEGQPELDAAVLDGLSTDELRNLAQAVAKESGARPIRDDEDAVAGLGAALQEQATELSKGTDAVKAATKGTTWKVGAATQAMLGEGLAGLAALREGLRATDVFQDFQRQHESIAAIARKATEEANYARSFAEAPTSFQSLMEQADPYRGAIRRALEEQERLEKLLGTPTLLESALKHMEEEKGTIGAIARQMAEDSGRADMFRKPEGNTFLDAIGDATKYTLDPGHNTPWVGQVTARAYDPVRIELTPQEETPIGHAMIASEATAAKLNEVVGFVAAIADKVAGLSQLVVKDVLPEWMTKLAEDKESAAKSTEQANESLKWTRRGVWVAVAVTFACTAWQLYIAHVYKVDSDQGQAASDRRAQAQLEATLRMNALLQAEVDQLRAAAAAASAAKVPLATKVSSSRPKQATHR